MLRSLSALALLLALSVSAYAEDAPVPSKPRIDETALRFFASQGRKDRVEAEARRLTKLDPAWRLPSDIWTARKGRADEGPLWALYREDRFADIDAAVAQRRAVEPGWNPSEDLQDKIRLKRLRAAVMDMARAGQWHAIVDAFRSSGIAWARGDAEALWVIAEAYARENDCAEAFVVYDRLLAEHDDPAERRSTIEHAIRLIPMHFVEKLLAMARKDANGVDEFAIIGLDVTRARIAAFLHDEPANAVSDAELAAFEAHVRDAADPDEPGLVAWYGYKRADYPLALEWFKLSLGRGGDAMIAHGLAHTLRMMGMAREAEEVAYAWRGPLVNNSILFIDLLERDLTKAQPPAIEPERLRRYAAVTMQDESGEGAQALGWYAYNTCQYPAALRWFERAVAWLPKEATVYGYALALGRMHRTRDVRDVVNRYDGLFPKVVDLAFDDGRRLPPPPCETDAGRGETATTATTGPSLDWTGRTMADTLRPVARPTAITSRSRVPAPDEAGNGAATVALVKRLEFPVAVMPDNPLRFSARVTVADEAGARGRENPGPLVARRVPGVGPMPYERWGFTLLPGWDGQKEASAPTAAERDPPAGTLWALELSLRDGGSTKLRVSPAQTVAPAAGGAKASADATHSGRPS